MEFKTVLSKFIYRIEAKPGGGFIATCKDLAAPPIEGATREEVQKKIQETIAASLSTQIPALKEMLANNDVKLHYHVEPKPGGGYLVHHGEANANSNDPAHVAMEGSTREHLENLIESKIFSAILKRLPPELHQQIADQINSGGGLDINVDRTIRVTTSRDGAATPLFDSEKNTSSAEQLASSLNLASTGPPSVVSASSSEIQLSAKSGSLNPGESAAVSPSWSDSSSSPITRYEKSASGSFFRFLLALAIVALLMSLFLYLRR